MKPTAALLLALALLAPTLRADDEKGPFDLAWRFEADQVVTYRTAPGEGAPDGAAGRTFKVHAFLLLPKGPDGRRVSTIAEIGDPLVLALPPDGTRVGRRWRATFEFRSIAGHQPFELKGGYVLKGWKTVDDHRFLEIAGAFEGSPLKAIGPPPGTRFRTARVETTALFDPEAGRVASATVGYDVELGTDAGKVAHTGRWRYEFVEAWRLEVDDFQKAIDEAVDKGVAWMKSQQQDDGSFGPKAAGGGHGSYPLGNASLCLLALLKSGVPRFDPVIHKGFDHLKTLPFEKTYSVALLILALEARHAPLKEKTADGRTVVHGAGQIRIPPDDKEWMERATRWLLEGRNSIGLWRYPNPENPTTYDHSNIQYAVLALKAASRCGIDVPVDAWRSVARHFIDGQEAGGPVVGLDRVLEIEGEGGDPRYEGGRREYARRAQSRGWGYTAGTSGYGSMTAAGIACLLLAQSGLHEAGALDRRTRAEIDAAVRDGLAWMGHNYDLLDNPCRHGAWYFYYIYGVERAMILSSTRLVAERDWYRDGASILLKLQGASGAWSTTSLVDTSFALLFLKRATTPVVIGSGG